MKKRLLALVFVITMTAGLITFGTGVSAAQKIYKSYDWAVSAGNDAGLFGGTVDSTTFVSPALKNPGTGYFDGFSSAEREGTKIKKEYF